MAASDLGPLQTNEHGEQVFKGTFLIFDTLIYDGKTADDFLIFHTLKLADLDKAGVGAAALKNIYQNYQITHAEYCFHTVYQEIGDPQNWYLYAAPWNRPFFCKNQTACKINPNMLPGCVFRVFSTGGYGTKIDKSGEVGQTEGGSNSIGAGGALYVSQHSPKYFLDVINNDLGNSSALPMSNKLPTYTAKGVDETAWATILTRHQRFTGYKRPVAWHFMIKVGFEFSGVRLSAPLELAPPEYELGAHLAHSKRCVPTFDSVETQERVHTLLCHQSTGDHKRRSDSLACLRQSESEPAHKLLRRSEEDMLDKETGEGSSRQHTDGIHCPLFSIH